MALPSRNAVAAKESPGRLHGGFAHRRDDILGVWPGFPKELGEQSALSGHDRVAVNEDVELPSATTWLELDMRLHGVLDVGSVTRCPGAEASGLAVQDTDVHSVDYSSPRGRS